jgi:hypothetical protein
MNVTDLQLQSTRAMDGDGKSSRRGQPPVLTGAVRTLNFAYRVTPIRLAVPMLR